MDRFLRMTLIFLVAYFALSLILPKPDQESPLSQSDVGIKLVDDTVAQGNLVKVLVQNNTDEDFVLGEAEYPPENLIFERHANGRWEELRAVEPQQIEQSIVLSPGTKMEFSFPEFNTELFFEAGDYRVVIRPESTQEFQADFEIFKPGFFRTLFRAVYKIVYNAFIFFLTIGNHNLGIAIILITVITKGLLWTVNKHALESQQKMQKLQPELQKIREKYKNDQQKMASETMGIWKKHKISPFAAFTPLLIQFPVLIALFYVIRDGLAPNNQFLLYPPFKDFDFSQINEVFLGLFDLSHHPLADKWLLWLPFVVAISQFWAMKLSFKRSQKKKAAEKKTPSSGDNKLDMANQMEMMSKTMQYILPLMIFFFTLNFPAGVGFYWLISTLIGVGQQHLVNKKLQK